MLSSKTVFIVGAGASQEVGMPIGWELRDIIADKLDMRFEFPDKFIGSGDSKVLGRLHLKYFSTGQLDRYMGACKLISDGIRYSDSIDDFIDLHRDEPMVAVCGKVAIAASILEKERESKLYVDPSNIYNTLDLDQIQGTWYLPFLRLLSTQVPKSDLDKLFENVTIICFNYDRCIEQFLYHAITKQYGIRREEALSLVAKLQIFRPYGSVGDYFGDVPFGSNNLPQVETVASSLRTYTEQIENTEGLRAIKTVVAEARTIVFLGSAFHANNMALLQPDAGAAVKWIFATRKGISESDLDRVHYMLSALRGIKPPMLAPHERNRFASTCNDLFDEHKLALRG
jgi:hypothetical protein